MNRPLDTDLNADWGFNGTNEFSFFDVKVTSVVDSSGENSMNDPVIGQSIVDNLKRPFSKLVDLDVDCQDKSTIYGMKFGVSWGEDENGAENVAFYGDWTRAVIAQDMWYRLKCYDNENFGPELHQDSFPFGSQGTTFLTDIEWGDVGDSQVLQELKAALVIRGSHTMSVRITLFYYTRNYPPYVALNATLGYVVGTIGLSQPDDTLNFGGQRLLSTTANNPLDLTFTPEDLCYDQEVAGYNPWLSKAPFEVDESRLEVAVDLSNALPSNLYNTLRDIGMLQLGILQTPNSESCVYLLGSDGIPYLSDGWLRNTGGIYVYQLDEQQAGMLADSVLVVVQVVSGSGGMPICGELPSVQGAHTVQILLQENPYFVRPWNYYVDRLEYQGISSQTLYVTYFGNPAPGTSVTVYQTNPDVLPDAAVTPDVSTKETDLEGKVTFTFTVNAEIPFPRQYADEQCSEPTTLTLPIDGQVYRFQYCVGGDACSPATDISEITFLAFSTVTYTLPPYWDPDVQPILAQYAHLNNIMKTILDLGDYWDVTRPSNIHLLELSMSVDFESPAYMPTTRDLSPTKQQMILQWLQAPMYSSDSPYPSQNPSARIGTHPAIAQARSSYTSYCSPPRCTATSISFRANPKDTDTYFEDILDRNNESLAMLKRRVKPVRPLFGYGIDRTVVSKFGQQGSCTLDDLKQQLQLAIELEFYTIPLYLTSLYSIVDGCNQEGYSLIATVVKQEMQHMTQAANILIAVGGSPLIDSPDIAPKYPAVGLPGGVLPSLRVSLQKLSLGHVYDTFMGAEVPELTLVGGPIWHPFTIGWFYNEIINCINDVGDDVFDPDRADLQVEWPWPAPNIGDVEIVTDKATALEAIENIIAQGEGSGPLDPTQINSDRYAHFFKFEEMVCQHRLVQVDAHHYAYNGVPIPFDPLGVWPMRDNPSADCIKPNTNCYTEAKNFHHAYRALLRKLQETFSGQPELVTATVEIMETLQVHAKKLMWTLFKPDSTETCGPVWDYEWED